MRRCWCPSQPSRRHSALAQRAARDRGPRREIRGRCPVCDVKQREEGQMAAFNFHRRRTRRGWIAGATAVAMVALVVVFAAGSGAAPSKVTRLATTPTTTTDCEGNTLNHTPPATYAATDLLKGSNFEIDAAIAPPSTAKKG